MKGSSLAALLLVIAPGGCGDSPAPSTPPAAKQGAVTAEPTPSPEVTKPKPPPKVILRVRNPRRTVGGTSAPLRGTVTPGTRVTVNGRSAAVSGKRFQLNVGLRVGKNRLVIVARRAGTKPVRRLAVITRKAPPPPPPPAPAPPVTPTGGYQPSLNGSCETNSGEDPDCPVPAPEG